MRHALSPEFVKMPLAHRALYDPDAHRPENSMPAIRAAIREGYGIEIDLQPSADGVAMVFHDDDLDRLTYDTGPVNARSAAELKRVRVRGCAEPIPTLRQVLAEVKGQVPLLIELKDQSRGTGPGDGTLERATAAALEGYSGPVAVMSFNPFSVARMAELAPDVARGLTTYAFPAKDFPDAGPGLEAYRKSLAEIAEYDRVEASFISHDWHDLDRPRVADLKAKGATVLCWTVCNRAQETTARRIADNITFENYQPEHP